MIKFRKSEKVVFRFCQTYVIGRYPYTYCKFVKFCFRRFNVEAALEISNFKASRIESFLRFHPTMVGQIRKFTLENFSGILHKPKCHIFFIMPMSLCLERQVFTLEYAATYCL